MNRELPITCRARYAETAWSPTGQPYSTHSLTEEGEQVARLWADGLRDTHQVAALGTKQSAKKRQTSRTRSIR